MTTDRKPLRGQADVHATNRQYWAAMKNPPLILGSALLIAVLAAAIAWIFLVPPRCSHPAVSIDGSAVNPEIQAWVNASNRFALELYCVSKDDSEYKDRNLLFSPYSISTTLTMTYEGARGKTAKELQSVFHLPENDEARRNAISKITAEINKHANKYEFATANALWTQQDFSFREDYLALLENHYGGLVRNVDFSGDTKGSRLVINRWVEERTNEKIRTLITPEALGAETRLILTSAVYFRGQWLRQFDKNDTKERDFRIAPQETIRIPMMHRSDDESIFNYAETSDFRILELPYSGEDLSMLIILPTDDLQWLESTLTARLLAQWRKGLAEQRVNVILPKFRLDTKHFMQETLGNMGMPTAFTNRADFSGMEAESTEALKIDAVIHRAFIEVDEAGTEAAAATAATAGNAAMERTIPTFLADHPFIFFIQQTATGNILFMGRVTDPRG